MNEHQQVEAVAPKQSTDTVVAVLGPAPTAAEIRDYMPLVAQTVARFVRKLPPNVLKDDLMAAGMYGLVDSLRRNPAPAGGERGPAFEWYARIRIKGAIVDELRAQDWLSRRARSQATREATESSPRSAVVSFEDMPGLAGALTSSTDESDSAFSQMSDEDDRTTLLRAVSSLPEREQYIVKAHYLEGVQFKTIAAKLGVSEPRVSQIHTRAMQLLRTAMVAA